ncbi:MAG: divergent polysaccharide deacetylase family protein [Pseudomonadota bacterium]
MARGFLSGLAVGALAGVFGLSVLSLAAPLPRPPQVGDNAPSDVASDVVSDAVAPDQAAQTTNAEMTGAGRDADLVEIPPTAPEKRDGEPDTLAALDGADTDPAARPDVADSDGALQDPATAMAPADMDTGGEDQPVTAGPQAPLPSQPADEVELSISTEPAQPNAPEVSQETAFGAPPEPEAAPEVASESDPELAAGETQDMAEPASLGLSTPALDDTRAAPQAPSDAPQVAALTQDEAADAGLDTPQAGASPSAPAVTAPAPLPSVGAQENVPDTPTTAAAPEPPTTFARPDASDASDGTTVLQAPATAAVPERAPLPSIGDESEAEPETAPDTAPDSNSDPSTDAPTTQARSRLPSIGAQSTPSTLGSGQQSRLPTIGAAAPAPEAAPVEEAPTSNTDLPPIQAHAVPFDNSDDKPLMSIVLIDGPDSVGAEALADFPYPLTFAVDPSVPGAQERMRAHRAAGFEVVALVDLPAAALPTDAEVSLDAGLNILNEAVAVLEGTGTGIQGNRPLSDQVTEIVGQSGLGLITQDNGLNTVPKLAAREGVPTATVFRDFDGAGQTPTVMRRFLDQAAFRAAQQGSVVMLGRVQPDTVSALLLWGLQDRASRVALAPISALLTKVP